MKIKTLSQLENVSPQTCGNFLQFSLVESTKHVPQVVIPIFVLLVKCTPPTQHYPNPSIEDNAKSQSAKQREANITPTPERHMEIAPMPTHIEIRWQTQSIGMIGQNYLGFQMHGAIFIQHGKSVLNENTITKEFATIGMPANEVNGI